MRERQVLELKAKGKTNAQVAKELGIAEQTVADHYKWAWKKAKISPVTAAARVLLVMAKAEEKNEHSR